MFIVYLKLRGNIADTSSGFKEEREKEYGTRDDAYADLATWPDDRLNQIKLAYDGKVFIDGRTIRDEVKRAKG
jgi:hypothetical protein